MRINTNVSALLANHHLNKTDNQLSKSMQRLSSGLKLNRAEDDAASFAIARKLRTQIASINQTGQNGNDGVSVIQTAEGALNEVESMLQRMRELAVQGANGTNTDEDREAIQKEVDSLKDEIVRISNQTQFTDITLLDGSLDRRSYCTVTGTGVNNNAVNTSSWGSVISTTNNVPANTYGIVVNNAATPAELSLTVNVPTSVNKASEGLMKINETEISIEEGDTKQSIEAKISEAASKCGATYRNGKLTTDGCGSDETLEISFSNTNVKGLFTTNPLKATGTDVEATFQIKNAERVGFQATANMLTEKNYITITDNSGFNMVVKVNGKGTYSFDVTDMGTMPIQIGIAEGQIMDLRVQTISLETLSISDLSCRTIDKCDKAMVSLDKAISYVSSVRGSLGAYQNRLESAVSSIAISEENVTAALSRIEDTDMAEEMTYYTQMNVLTQAGISVLTQANERPQMVLQLLQ